MSRTLKLTLVAVFVGAAVAATALVTRGGASRDVATLSNQGRPTMPIRGLRMESARITSGNVLGVRGTRALYRLDRANGEPCFGVGPASDLGTPGSVVCPRGGFPTAGNPVLDLSVYEGTRHELRELSLFRVEGFAADGVAAIQFFRPNGAVALTVPVTGNVYATAAVPTGPVAGLAALDKAGKRMWRSPPA
jgi:hypothetical protein